MKKGLLIFSVAVLLTACGSEEEQQQMSICDCYKWGKDLEVKALEALSKSSGDMAKVEEEQEMWDDKCRDQMTPIKMSEKKRMLEEIENCK